MKPPPLPTSVTVPPYDYAITSMDIDEADAGETVGDWRFHPEAIIRIDTRASYRKQAATLDHEIGHGVLRESGGSRRLAVYAINWHQRNPTPSDEERDEFIEAFEEMVIEVTFEAAHSFRRFSPDVVKWIDRGLVKG